MPVSKRKDQRQRMPGKEFVRQVQRLLASAPDGQVSAQKLAAMAGLEHRAFQRRAAELVALGHVSRTKVREQGGAFYRYSLSEKQREVVELEERVERLRGGDAPLLFIQPSEATDRLSFLRMLKERTIFGDHSMLKLIIADYEGALKQGLSIDRSGDDVYRQQCKK